MCWLGTLFWVAVCISSSRAVIIWFKRCVILTYHSNLIKITISLLCRYLHNSARLLYIKKLRRRKWDGKCGEDALSTAVIDKHRSSGCFPEWATGDVLKQPEKVKPLSGLELTTSEMIGKNLKNISFLF